MAEDYFEHSVPPHLGFQLRCKEVPLPVKVIDPLLGTLAIDNYCDQYLIQC